MRELLMIDGTFLSLGKTERLRQRGQGIVIAAFLKSRSERRCRYSVKGDVAKESVAKDHDAGWKVFASPQLFSRASQHPSHRTRRVIALRRQRIRFVQFFNLNDAVRAQRAHEIIGLLSCKHRLIYPRETLRRQVLFEELLRHWLLADAHESDRSTWLVQAVECRPSRASDACVEAYATCDADVGAASCAVRRRSSITSAVTLTPLWSQSPATGYSPDGIPPGTPFCGILHVTRRARAALRQV